MCFKIETFGDFAVIFEDYDDKTGERNVKRTGFAAVGSDDQAYFGLREAAPDTIADDHLYVKRPDWGTYRDMAGTDFLPRSLLEEAAILETLTKHPHPNIVRYHGCRVRRGRITSLVLDKYSHDLNYARVVPEELNGRLDKDRIMAGVKAAVEHLHSIGLAHNDLNPGNIMIAEDGKPILIDFGSCQPDGEYLSSTGTPGWYKEAFRTSDRAHDLYGLEKLGPWLDEWIS